MTKNQKLGKLWVSLNCWEWDEDILDKPKCFNSLSQVCKETPEQITTYDVINPIMDTIKIAIGERKISWYWFKYSSLDRNYFQWLYWWHYDRKRKIL